MIYSSDVEPFWNHYPNTVFSIASYPDPISYGDGHFTQLEIKINHRLTGSTLLYSVLPWVAIYGIYVYILYIPLPHIQFSATVHESIHSSYGFVADDLMKSLRRIIFINMT